MSTNVLNDSLCHDYSNIYVYTCVVFDGWIVLSPFLPLAWPKSWRLNTVTSLISPLEHMLWRSSQRHQLKCKEDILLTWLQNYKPHPQKSFLKSQICVNWLELLFTCIPAFTFYYIFKCPSFSRNRLVMLRFYWSANACLWLFLSNKLLSLAVSTVYMHVIHTQLSSLFMQLPQLSHNENRQHISCPSFILLCT